MSLPIAINAFCCALFSLVTFGEEGLIFLIKYVALFKIFQVILKIIQRTHVDKRLVIQLRSNQHKGFRPPSSSSIWVVFIVFWQTSSIFSRIYSTRRSKNLYAVKFISSFYRLNTITQLSSTVTNSNIQTRKYYITSHDTSSIEIFVFKYLFSRILVARL